MQHQLQFSISKPTLPVSNNYTNNNYSYLFKFKTIIPVIAKPER